MSKRVIGVFVLCFTSVGLLGAQGLSSGSVPPGAKLYVAPMEWNLDRFVVAEIRKQGLCVQLVSLPEEADFVMTSLYQNLGSRLISPGHFIQVTIVAAPGGNQVWTAEVSDYGLFFGRLRPHGPGRAAEAIVKKFRNDMSGVRQ